MPEPTALNRVVQIGPETTAGTAVPATRKLAMLGMDLEVDGVFQRVKPVGKRYATVSLLNQISSNFVVSGGLSSNEIVYPLASIFGKTTPTLTGGLQVWVFTGVSGVVIDPQTFTVELSDGTTATQVTNTQFSGLTIAAARAGEVTVNGSAIGAAMTLAVTPTAALAQIPEYPIPSSAWNVYYDASLAGLGTTQLLKVVKFSWEMPEVWGKAWYLNRSKPSISGTVEQEANPQMRMTVAWDAVAQSIYTSVLAQSTRFIRFGASLLFGSNTHTITIDAAVKGAGFSPFTNEDGIYAMEFVFDIVEDTTWGKAQVIGVSNLLSSF